MKTFLGLLTLVMIVLLSVSAVTASSSPTYTLAPEVLASGEQVASSANYSFVSTFGQPLVGPSNSAAYSTCSGFWCQIAAGYRVYLPAILKEN